MARAANGMLDDAKVPSSSERKSVNSAHPCEQCFCIIIHEQYIGDVTFALMVVLVVVVRNDGL
jgi:hypothetical protein